MMEEKMNIDQQLWYDYFVFEHAYQLVEPLHLELDTVIRHYLDYSYTPIMEQHDVLRMSSITMVMMAYFNPREMILVANLDDGLSAGNKNDKASFYPPKNQRTPVCKPVISKDEHTTTSSPSWWKWWFPCMNTSWWKSHGMKSDFGIAEGIWSDGGVTRGHTASWCEARQPQMMFSCAFQCSLRVSGSSLSW
jgi:hypothetical protein